MSAHKKNKRGVTLAELICVLALLGILGGLAGTAMYSAGKQYQSAMDLNSAKAAVDTMQLQLTNQLRYVKGPVAVYGMGLTGATVLQTYDGKLWKWVGYEPRTDFFADMPEIYAGFDYEISFTTAQENSVVFHFSVMRGQKQIYSTDYTLHFLNAAVTPYGHPGQFTLYYYP
ncbi:MAG: prepilin-type N-terminal cleavage/methylation domain-containing protein [Ruthenibacterium sp.]